MTRPKHESLAYLEDELGGYEWGFTELFRDTKGDDDIFYIVKDGGCSCSYPLASYGPDNATYGPYAALGDLMADVVQCDDVAAKRVFLMAVKSMNRDTEEALARELGLE